MKTAMQELIEWTAQYEGKMISADQVILNAYELLEKEKKQIIKAFQNGTCEPYAPMYKSEEYYNNLFNQTEDDENLKFY